MKTEHKMIDNQNSQHIVANHPQEQNRIGDLITQSWGTIAPTWPLKNLIAANPLAGLEDLTFEEAVRNGQAYFQQRELPAAMHNVNRETIKWLQAFFDEGQATIKMPARQLGLYAAVKQLLRFDWRVTGVHSKTCDCGMFTVSGRGKSETGTVFDVATDDAVGLGGLCEISHGLAGCAGYTSSTSGHPGRLSGFETDYYLLDLARGKGAFGMA